jgi:glycosyltransferase involved in cell wall biosynthesis
MRIALIDPSLFTWPYDAALALALQSEGHELKIFGKPLDIAGAGPARELLQPHFYRWLSTKLAMRLPRKVFAASKGLTHIWEMGSLLEQLKAFQPDVIHFQWTPLPIVDRLFLPKLRAIAPLVLTVHDTLPHNGSPGWGLQNMSALSILSKFDELIVHTQAGLERLRSYGLPEAHIRRIPHGPLGSDTAIAGSTKPARGAGQPISILLFGQIKAYKGVDVLLKAAAAMPRETLAKCRVRIIGKAAMDLAPFEEIIRSERLGEFVQLEPRFVPETEVNALLASADIIVLPYRAIDVSGVLMASLAAGVPIVATRIGVFAEILEDGKHGRLIAVDDHVALARALEELVNDAGLRERMGAAARELRDEVPSWQSIATSTTQLYTQLLERMS